MREIKFRAWDGSEMHYGPAIEFGENGQLLFHSLGDSLLEGCPLEESAGHAVMQFTSLKDKNGKEIYEGDIVRVVYDGNLEHAGGDDEVRQVVWGADDADDYYPAFDLKGNPMEINALSCAKNNGDIEVIGNIYSNPELLAPKE